VIDGSGDPFTYRLVPFPGEKYPGRTELGTQMPPPEWVSELQEGISEARSRLPKA